MQLVYPCPACQAPNIDVITSTQKHMQCGVCDWQKDIPASSLDGEKPRCCLACGNPDLWRQKDFPQGLGLLMVVSAATMSTIAWAYVRPMLAIGILMAFALIDMVLYWLMRDVLVCYRCHAKHRRAQMDDDHPRFNLELAERYRQEDIRLAEAKKQSASDDA